MHIGIRRFPSRWKNVLCESVDSYDHGSSESGKLTWNGRYIYYQLKNRFFLKSVYFTVAWLIQLMVYWPDLRFDLAKCGIESSISC